MASSCPTTRWRSWFSRSSACLPVLVGSSNVSFGIASPSALRQRDLGNRARALEILQDCDLRLPGTVYNMQPRVPLRAASGGCLHRTRANAKGVDAIPPCTESIPEERRHVELTSREERHL